MQVGALVQLMFILYIYIPVPYRPPSLANYPWPLSLSLSLGSAVFAGILMTSSARTCKPIISNPINMQWGRASTAAAAVMPRAIVARH